MTTPAKPVPVLPPPYSVAAVIDRMVNVARSQLGYREALVHGDWNNDNAYGLWYGMNRAAWCAIFMSWCAHKAGLLDTVIPRHAWTPSGLSWFRKQGREMLTPARGDLFYVHNTSLGRVAHVGLVTSVTRKNGHLYITTVEGNTNTNGDRQGNGVYTLTRLVSSALHFCRPDYAKAVIERPKPKPLPRLSKSEVIHAATHAEPLAGSESRIRLIKASLRVLGCGNDRTDSFRVMWRRWQVKCGYTGKDADGIPGDDSIRKLASRCGYAVTA